MQGNKNAKLNCPFHPVTSLQCTASLQCRQSCSISLDFKLNLRLYPDVHSPRNETINHNNADLSGCDCSV